MDKLEIIRTVHLVDHHLGRLANILTPESLKKKVLAIGDEWRELAHAITAQLCGVEPNVSKKSVRKKVHPPNDAMASGDEVSNDGEENSSIPLSSTLSATYKERN